MILGTQIKERRKKNELENAAEFVGGPYQTAFQWECGRAYFDIILLPQITEFIGCG